MGAPPEPPSPERPPKAGARAALTLRYEAVEGLRRERLPDVRHGIIVRACESIEAGDELDLWIQVTREGAAAAAVGTALWTMPLARGTLVGLELRGASARDATQLDVLLGTRGTTAGEGGGAPATGGGRLSVLMLQPNPVLRQVLASALSRFAVEQRGYSTLDLDVAEDADAFLAASGSRPRHLAIVDCDGLPTAPDELVSSLRARRDGARLPVIVLSESRAARLEDSHTVTMRKPVAMKALLQTTGILVRG